MGLRVAQPVRKHRRCVLGIEELHGLAKVH